MKIIHPRTWLFALVAILATALASWCWYALSVSDRDLEYMDKCGSPTFMVELVDYPRALFKRSTSFSIRDVELTYVPGVAHTWTYSCQSRSWVASP